MEPALIATEALSKDSINIIEGEFIAETLISQTSKLGSPIGKQFHKVLIERVNSRRNAAVISLALYLFNQDSLSKPAAAAYPLKLESKSATQQFGTKLLKQLFACDEDEPTLDDDIESNSRDSADADLTLQEKMKRAIDERWGKGKANQTEKPSTQTSAVQKSFRSYDKDRIKGPILEKLLLALCSVPPTSTQSERNFSLIGNFITKLRTRLTPDHVDMLSFLKSHFLNKP